MDPNANLSEQLRLAKLIEAIWDDCPEDGNFTGQQSEQIVRHGVRLAELVSALDEWRGKGGFLPERWAAAARFAEAKAEMEEWEEEDDAEL
jgi:hypothetical protein